MKSVHQLGPLTLTLCGAARPSSVCCFLLPAAVPENLAEIGENQDAAFLFLTGMDWDHDLSPWPAEGLFPGQDFSGKGQDFLRRLREEIFPYAEDQLQVKNPVRFLGGVSMGGLFSLWAAAEGFPADGIASLSGSLWFDRFLHYLEERPMPPRLKRVYLSLGNKEKRTRNRRLAAVEACTEKTAKLLRRRNIETVFQKNRGNHFDFPEERLEEAVRYLLTGKVWKGPHSL